MILSVLLNYTKTKEKSSKTQRERPKSRKVGLGSRAPEEIHKISGFLHIGPHNDVHNMNRIAHLNNTKPGTDR